MTEGSWRMVGRCPRGSTVRWSRRSTPMVVVDLWQDTVVVQSSKSGRRFCWQDTEFVYVEES